MQVLGASASFDAAPRGRLASRDRKSRGVLLPAWLDEAQIRLKSRPFPRGQARLPLAQPEHALVARAHAVGDVFVAGHQLFAGALGLAVLEAHAAGELG
jgi:hypothetical protein